MDTFKSVQEKSQILSEYRYAYCNWNRLNMNIHSSLTSYSSYLKKNIGCFSHKQPHPAVNSGPYPDLSAHTAARVEQSSSDLPQLGIRG